VDRPLVLLINNRSYSDARSFLTPSAAMAWQLVGSNGAPCHRHAHHPAHRRIAFRTPRIGIHTVKAVNMEKEGGRSGHRRAVHPASSPRRRPELDAPCRAAR